MKQDIAAKWVKALRSGEYQQGKQLLECDNHFCCLGVLCDIAVKDGFITKQTIVRETYEDAVIAYDDAKVFTILPNEILEWSGIKTNNAILAKTAGIHSLIYANDVKHNTFYQIADLIDQHWENL